jgi:ribonuclease HI
LRQKYVLTVFIDIASAFDRLDPKAGAKALRDRGIDENIVKWYENYLLNRISKVDIKGETAERDLRLGCPQGGILSVLLWNLAFDDLLKLYVNDNLTIIGYADDGCLIIEGTNPEQMVSQMNKALNKACKWATEKGLKLSPEKTIVMLSSKKTKTFKEPKNKVKVYGKPVEFSNSATYLGVIIDKKLTWTEHLNHKIKQAKRLLFKIRSAIGKLWGPSPEAMLWAYKAMVRSVITYGAFAWGHSLNMYKKNELSKLQRLALDMVGHFRRGTPKAGLDIILGIPPLDLHIDEEIMKARVRLDPYLTNNWNGMGKGKAVGHIKYAEYLCADNEIALEPTSHIPTTHCWDKKFTVNEDSFKKGLDVEVHDKPDGYLRVYTDGSKLDNKTGLGFCIMDAWPAPLVQKSVGLADNNTVNQCEMKALELAAIEVLSYIRSIEHLPYETKPPKVDFLSDSQISLICLASNTINCQQTLDAITALNTLGEHTTVELHWIKAHADYKGNELADELAKEGTLLPDSIGAATSRNAKKTEIKQATMKNWNERWNNLDTCRQTKIFFPHVDLTKSKKIIKEDKSTVSTLVQVLTGHNFLNRHEGLIDRETQKTCTFCGYDDQEETASHLVTDCEVLWRERGDCFKSYFLDKLSPQWDVPSLVKFLNKPQVYPLFLSNTYNPEHATSTDPPDNTPLGHSDYTPAVGRAPLGNLGSAAGNSCQSPHS